MKKPVTSLFEWIWRSSELHAVALAAIAWIAFHAPVHKPPVQPAVCEFVLQQRSERNDEKTNRIALNSAKAHGKRDPHDDPNKVEGAPSGGARAPAGGAQAASLHQKRAIARRYQNQRTAVAHQNRGAQATSLQPRAKARRYQQEERAERPRSTPEAVAEAEMPKPAPDRRNKPAPIAVAVAAADTAQDTTPFEREDAAANQSETQSHSFMREFTGRHLNPDRDTDDSAPSQATNASPDFGPYMNYLHRVLAKAWAPPGGSGGHCVKVLFDLHRAGEISGLHIIRSCGNAQYDRAALQAVSEASPFRPLPAGAPSSVSIEYTFDYHVLHQR